MSQILPAAEHHQIVITGAEEGWVFTIWRSKCAPWAHPDREPIWEFLVFAGNWAKSHGWNCPLTNSKSFLSTLWSFTLWFYFCPTDISAYWCLPFFLPVQFKPTNTYWEFIRSLLTVAHDPALAPGQPTFHRSLELHIKMSVQSMFITCFKSQNLPGPSPHLTGLP